jgi:hypothetical protein
MKLTNVLKVLAIVLMAVVLLVLAAWASSLWGSGIALLSSALPDGNEPIATALRGWLPAVKSAGSLIVLVVAAILGWGFGRRIWEA